MSAADEQTVIDRYKRMLKLVPTAPDIAAQLVIAVQLEMLDTTINNKG